MERLYCLCIATLVLWLPGKLMAQASVPGDTAQVMAYLAVSDQHYYAERMDSAAHYCLKAGELARKLNYKRGIAEFVSYYIPVLNRQGKYQEALGLALESLEVCKSLGDNSMLAMAYNNLGNQHQYLGDLKSSATNYLNALIFSESADTPQRRQRYSNNLASVFLQLEEKDKSYYYASKSYKLALETQDSIGMASSLVNLALSEVLNEKFEDALAHLDKVFVLGKALEDDSYVLDALINKADVYSKMKKYPAALQLYKRSFAVLKDYPVPDYELYVYWGLAQNYFHLGQYEAANDYLVKSINVANDLQALQELSKLYLLGSEINEKTNRHPAALEFRKQYEALNDSLVGVETRQNIHRLEIEYQTSQKEKAIADQQLVIAKNNLDIAKKDRFIFLWSAIAVFLLSAILIFVIVYRNKQRLNAEKIQLLSKQNELQVLNALIEGEEKERSRLARELHDGVGGILSASKMHLSIIQDEAGAPRWSDHLSNISAMLDQASQEIRTIAHNLFPDILLMHDLNVALGNYCQRMRSSGLNVEYYCLGSVPPLNNRFKLAVYRAVQELINNVIKHSQADHVLVQMSCHQDVLTVVVEDNGIGFDQQNTTGIGLLSLRDKVRHLDGKLLIDSAPGKGTTVQMEFELKPAKAPSVIEHSTVNS